MIMRRIAQIAHRRIQIQLKLAQSQLYLTQLMIIFQPIPHRRAQVLLQQRQLLQLQQPQQKHQPQRLKQAQQPQ